MRFQLLGPLEVYDGERLVKVPTARARALLAGLLLEAGQAVPLTELTERLWGDSPPENARAAIQLNVRRLRQALGDEDATLIKTRTRGYQIDVVPDELDLLSFRALVDLARRTEDLLDRADALKRALGLWRGPALSDVASDVLQRNVVPQLNEEHLAARQLWAETELALGHHASVVPALTATTRDHPHSEGAWEHLMLALYRCGRQADALEAYRELYDLLDRDLGVTPGRSVRELHERILKADSTLDYRPDPAGFWVSAAPPPRQLPAITGDFVGRTDALRDLDALLLRLDDPAQNAVLVATIVGPPGVGKTTLAVHWAHRVIETSERFPDGQLFVNLRGFDPSPQRVDAASALERMLEALGVPTERIPRDLEPRVDLYRSLVADRRMLIVLDNAYNSDHVRPLVPGSPHSLVIVTSRNRLTSLVAAEAAYPLMLGLLSVDEGRELLARRLGPERVARSPKATTEIVTACARLPLALAVVASRTATHPTFSLEAMAEELRTAASNGGLDVFSGEDTTSDVRAIFSWSYRTLSPPAAVLFRLLGLPAGPDIGLGATASLAGLSTAETRLLLSELSRAHLIAEHAPGRFGLHDLLRAYAVELVRSVESTAARERLLDYYLHSAVEGSRLLYPQRDPIDLPPAAEGAVPEGFTDRAGALEWFRREHAALIAAVEQAAASGTTADDRRTWQLGWALQEYLDPQGHWSDLVAVQTRGLAAAERLDDRLAQGPALRGLAAAHARSARFQEARAFLTRALELSQESGDVVGHAHTYRTYAWVVEQQGDHEGALEHATRALDLYELAAHPVGQAAAMNDIGWHHACLGRYRKALAWSGKALVVLEGMDHRHGQAATWESLGYAHHHVGEFSRAIACYERALALYRDLGIRYHEAETLTSLGETYEATGAIDAARSVWREALEILRELSHPDADRLRARLGRGRLARAY